MLAVAGPSFSPRVNSWDAGHESDLGLQYSRVLEVDYRDGLDVSASSCWHALSAAQGLTGRSSTSATSSLRCSSLPWECRQGRDFHSYGRTH